MKFYLKIVAGFLLFFNGVGAIYGGLNLIIFPSGGSLNLSVEYLKYSPFNDYLIPGIILIAANGLLSMYAFIAMLIDTKNHALLIRVQGLILTAWILIQSAMLHSVKLFHVSFGVAGLVLIACGCLLQDEYNGKVKHGCRMLNSAT